MSPSIQSPYLSSLQSLPYYLFLFGLLVSATWLTQVQTSHLQTITFKTRKELIPSPISFYSEAKSLPEDVLLRLIGHKLKSLEQMGNGITKLGLAPGLRGSGSYSQVILQDEQNWGSLNPGRNEEQMLCKQPTVSACNHDAQGILLVTV